MKKKLVYRQMDDDSWRLVMVRRARKTIYAKHHENDPKNTYKFINRQGKECWKLSADCKKEMMEANIHWFGNPYGENGA